MSDIKDIIKGCLSGVKRDQDYTVARQKYAVCLQYSGNDDEARDILQDGFIKIFENLAYYKYNCLKLDAQDNVNTA